MDAARKVEATEAHGDDPWVSLNAAAEMLGRAKNTVLLQALDGKIRHQKVAGRRFFHRTDLETLRATIGADEAEE